MITGENKRRALESDEYQRLKAATNEDRRKRILHRYNNGDDVQSIAAGLGKPDVYVYRVLEDAGVTFPKRTVKNRPSLTRIIRNVRGSR